MRDRCSSLENSDGFAGILNRFKSYFYEIQIIFVINQFQKIQSLYLWKTNSKKMYFALLIKKKKSGYLWYEHVFTKIWRENSWIQFFSRLLARYQRQTASFGISTQVPVSISYEGFRYTSSASLKNGTVKITVKYLEL